MIVDDESDNLEVLGEMLRRQGWRTRAFPRGQLALDSARQDPPDLLLLDILMPDLDGFDVCTLFKAEESLRPIPVLFISALSAAPAIDAAFECGGVDYICKPFRETDVLARVRTHLALRQAYVDLAAEHAKLRMLEHLRGLLTTMLLRHLQQSMDAMYRELGVFGQSAINQTPNCADCLKTIVEGTSQLTHVVNTGLGVNRLVSCGTSLHRVAIPVAELFQAATFEDSYSIDSHCISTTITDSCPAILCDPELSGCVIAELVINALKRSPEGTHISLWAGPVPNGVRIWVRDEGPGMAEDDQTHFELLGADDAALDPPPPSIGLDLLFCKLAIEAQGGTMGVEDEHGQGGNFWFTLPTANPSSGIQTPAGIGSRQGQLTEAATVPGRDAACGASVVGAAAAFFGTSPAGSCPATT
ncbi:MAG: hybrid sensor histidine kinase/response regulator [Verrucomicrobiota bacterium]